MLLENKNIFLLEDDPVNFSVIQTILRKNGAATLLDYWGDTTLKKMMNYPFQLDLILLDIMLPGRATGYDVLDAIRMIPEFKDIPIVAITASDPDTEIPKARKRGFDGYISKPINRYRFPKQLVAILNGESIWE
ncbi:MAG: response regulator [Chloroflexi bacterium]|nr:response regulator [Chloroflexota bacterium]